MKKFQIASYLFFALALLFIILGAYMVVQSLEYVTTYSSPESSSGTTVFQYVVTSSMAYFGFGFVFAGIGAILFKQEQIIALRSAKEADKEEIAEAGKEDAAPIKRMYIGPADDLIEEAEEPVVEEPSPAPEEPPAEEERPAEEETPVEEEHAEPLEEEPAEEEAQVSEETQDPLEEPPEEVPHEEAPEEPSRINFSTDFIRDIFENEKRDV